MLFPWIGLLEQIRLADVLVHYDDVQLSQRSFIRRVQVKTATGIHWMTVPLDGRRRAMAIDELKTAPITQWRGKHLALLTQSFQRAQFAGQALTLAREVYAVDYPSIGHLARASMLALGHYFGLLDGKRIIDSRDLRIGGSGTERILNIVRAVGGTVYITGHGARNYLDHDAFEQVGVDVQYMRYERRPYPQRWGEFTPYVTSLDLVASLGHAGRSHILSSCVPWRKFISGSEEEVGQG